MKSEGISSRGNFLKGNSPRLCYFIWDHLFSVPHRIQYIFIYTYIHTMSRQASVLDFFEPLASSAPQAAPTSPIVGHPSTTGKSVLYFNTHIHYIYSYIIFTFLQTLLSFILGLLTSLTLLTMLVTMILMLQP
jgi:hypothetical protein